MEGSIRIQSRLVTYSFDDPIFTQYEDKGDSNTSLQVKYENLK